MQKSKKSNKNLDKLNIHTIFAFRLAYAAPALRSYVDSSVAIMAYVKYCCVADKKSISQKMNL